jgi:hypothetical protein
MDNYAPHKTKPIRDWLAKRPRWHVHFTPTGASRINQVERFFALLTEKQIRRGIHHSTRTPEQDIRAFIQIHNQNPRPFRWTKSADDILDAVKRINSIAASASAIVGMPSGGLPTSGAAIAMQLLKIAGSVQKKAKAILVRRDSAKGGTVWVDKGPPSSSLESGPTALDPELCELFSLYFSDTETIPVGKVLAPR